MTAPKTRKKTIEDHAPYLPADYTPGHVLAMQRLSVGEANEEEQKMALQWIIEKAAGTYDVSYRPDSERDSVFAEGRRFTGLQIVKLLHINSLAMKEKA